MLDCVISNNVADQYSAACYGTYMRTKFLENEARQFIILAWNYVSCLFAGIRITVGNGTYSAPFGNKAWVLVRKGGASQVIKAKYSKLTVVFNHQGFDNSALTNPMKFMDL